jgi:hypothetical protein
MQRETKHIRLGFLYPGHTAEDDDPLLAMKAGQGITVHVVHTSQDEDAHRVREMHTRRSHGGRS